MKKKKGKTNINSNFSVEGKTKDVRNTFFFSFHFYKKKFYSENWNTFLNVKYI